MTNRKDLILRDINGMEIRTGQIVKIENGFFKSDNGIFLVRRSPGDPEWSGSDYSLRKMNKNGTLSKSKNNIQFWPLMVTVNSREKRAEAREHNSEYATIEIIKEATTQVGQ